MFERLRWFGLVALVLGAGEFAHLWGAGLRGTPDTASYLDGARHLADGLGFTISLVEPGSDSLRPIANFAPLFSGLMVPGIWAGLADRESAALVLALSYVAYGVGTYLLLIAIAGARWWPAALAAAVMLLLMPSTLSGLEDLLSDLTSAAFAVGTLFLATSLVTRRHAPGPAWLALGLALGALLLTRWAALYFVLPLAAGVALALSREHPPARRLGTAAWLLGGAGAVALPWLLRNRVLTGDVMGRRSFGFDGSQPGHALEGLAAVFLEAREWIAELPFLSLAYPALVLAAVALLAALFWTGRGWRDPALRLLLVTGGGYAALLTISASVSPIDPVSRPRFWLPVVPIALAIALGTLARSRPEAPLRPAAELTTLLAAVGSGALFLGSAMARFEPEREPFGYLDPVWRQSIPVRYALDRAPDCALFSNNPYVLIALGDVGRIHMLPVATEDLLPLLRAGERVCIVFIRRGATTSMARGNRQQAALISSLADEGWIRRVAADEVGALWVSSYSPLLPGAAP
jgi:hypothetical protein